MQSAMASEEGCKTITWKIENSDFLLLKERLFFLCSPALKIEGSTWWKLCVSNIMPDIVFKIEVLKGSSTVDRWEMSFISSRGEIPLKESFSGSHDFILEKNALFDEIDLSNLSNNTLTLCCRMREGNINSSELHISSVLNSLSYKWNIRDFSLSSFPHTYIEQGNILFYVSLEKKDGQLDHVRTVSVREVPCVEGCISSVVSFSIKDGPYLKDVFVINKPPLNEPSEAISFCDIHILSKNLSITLQLELMVAYHRVCQEQLSLHSPTEIPGHENVSGAGSCELGRDFLHLYRENVLSDVTLHAEDPPRSFSAHRSILAARSPVFRTMFEESSGCRSVDMDGVDSDTVGRMMVYLYGHSLGDLEWKKASALYCAADKYDVVLLKEKCAAILEACLTVDHARDALVLADSCSDQALMERVILFILDHEEVVSSAQWEELEKDNPALAAKITRRLFLRRGKRMRVA